MSISSTTLDSRFSDILIVDTDVDETVTVDITGGTGSVYYIQLVNSWAGSSVFFKLYDAGDVTLGTTHPIFVVKVPASTTKNLVIPDGMQFTTALSFAATDQGGSGAVGTPLPTSALTVRIVTS